MKEKIVCAWTDQVRDLRNTIMNRVEYANGRLRKWLRDSKGDFLQGLAISEQND